LRLYAAHLAEFADDDLRAAARSFAREPRAEGKTAFPALGDLIARLESRARATQQERQSRIQHEEAERWFWQWVDERLEDTGKPEQEFLDGIRVPGYTGRKARR
jgi:hypothetical protein